MKQHGSPYRRGLERTLLILASLGILLTAHLSYWYGDTEVADPICTGASDCAAVIANDPTFLGLSSAHAGLIFYGLVAMFTLAITRDWFDLRRTLKVLRLILVIAGMAYSTFLTILQLFALEDFCVLCLGSFLLVSAMTAVLVIMVRKPVPLARRSTAGRQPSEMAFFGITAAILAAAVVTDYTIYRARAPAPSPDQLAGQVYNPELCEYDASHSRFENLDQFISDDDPVTGYPSAPVTIIEFIDPNCPACKNQHPVMKALAAKYPQLVRIVTKPVALITGSLLFSLDEVMALWLANEQGRYDRMIDAMFEAQSPQQGLSVDELADLASDVGMNRREFRQELLSRRLEPKARSTRRIFDAMSLGGVPAILINGRKVHARDRSLGCLSHLVAEELPEVFKPSE